MVKKANEKPIWMATGNGEAEAEAVDLMSSPPSIVKLKTALEELDRISSNFRYQKPSNEILTPQSVGKSRHSATNSDITGTGRSSVTYSKDGVSLSVGKSRKKKKLKKRVLCTFDGQRRLRKDDTMLGDDSEVRMKLPNAGGDSWVTDLDVETMKRAEGFHNATEEERGPWIPSSYAGERGTQLFQEHQLQQQQQQQQQQHFHLQQRSPSTKKEETRNERPYTCPITSCELHKRGFARKYDVERHLVTAHFKATIVCGFCPGPLAEKKFNRFDVFKRHLVSVHGVEQSPTNPKKTTIGTSSVRIPPAQQPSGLPEGATGECSTCDQIFATPQELFEHYDGCVLREVTQTDPAEEANMKNRRSVAEAGAIEANLAQQGLPTVHGVERDPPNLGNKTTTKTLVKQSATSSEDTTSFLSREIAIKPDSNNNMQNSSLTQDPISMLESNQPDRHQQRTELQQEGFQHSRGQHSPTTATERTVKEIDPSERTLPVPEIYEGYNRSPSLSPSSAESEGQTELDWTDSCTESSVKSESIYVSDGQIDYGRHYCWLQAIVEHAIMELKKYVWECGDSFKASCTMGDRSSSAKEGAQFNRSSGTNRARKRSRRSNNNVPEEDKGDSELEDRRPKRRKQESQVPGTASLLGLACLFHKHDPWKHCGSNGNLFRTCSTPFPNMKLLKEHCTRSRRHLAPWHCTRCYTEFDTSEELEYHRDSATTACEPRPRKVYHAITEKKKSEYNFRTRKMKSEAEKWKEMYKIVFEVEDEDVPSPYYEVVGDETCDSKEIEALLESYRGSILPNRIRELDLDDADLAGKFHALVDAILTDFTNKLPCRNGRTAEKTLEASADTNTHTGAESERRHIVELENKRPYHIEKCLQDPPITAGPRQCAQCESCLSCKDPSPVEKQCIANSYARSWLEASPGNYGSQLNLTASSPEADFREWKSNFDISEKPHCSTHLVTPHQAEAVCDGGSLRFTSSQHHKDVDGQELHTEEIYSPQLQDTPPSSAESYPKDAQMPELDAVEPWVGETDLEIAIEETDFDLTDGFSSWVNMDKLIHDTIESSWYCGKGKGVRT